MTKNITQNHALLGQSLGAAYVSNILISIPEDQIEKYENGLVTKVSIRAKSVNLKKILQERSIPTVEESKLQ